MSHFNIVLIVAALAAVGITLSSIAIDKTMVLDGRVNDLTMHTSQAASSSKAMSSPMLFKDPAVADALMSKAAVAVSLHPFCKQNPGKCAEHVESIHRMVKGLSCDLVTKGLYKTFHVDVAISHDNNVICAGPTYNTVADVPRPPKTCDIKLNGVCVGYTNTSFSIHFGDADKRVRRSGSVDLNGNWDQNNGASVNGEFKDNWGNSNVDLKGGWSQGQGANVQGSYNYNFDNNRGSFGVQGGWSQNGGANVGVGFHYNF